MKRYNGIYEFTQEFSTPSACYEYLYNLKWSEGYTCRKCGNTNWYKGKRWHHRRCKKCNYDESSVAHTLFHKLKFPIVKAFMITYQLSTMKKGMSSCEIARQYGVHQETAWFFRRKVQKAMQSFAKKKLQNNVEVDETMLGGVDPGKRGRSRGKKRLVQVALEVDYPEGSNKVKLKNAMALVIEDSSANSLGKGLKKMVDPEALITTDGWSGYKPAAKNYWHEVFLSENGDNFKKLHWHIFNIKNWIRGIHHRIAAMHLQAYLDEYHFRFNSRNHLNSNPKLVLKLMSNHAWFPYKSAIGT
jgi:predicted nucleic-acid-binding Zn-ribbon protein